MFLTVCFNPVIQKTLRYPSIIPGTVNRTSVHRIDASGKGINVTRVLTQLGKKAVHLTQLGGSMRPMFLSLCEQDDLSVEWVESSSEIRFCYTLLTDRDVTELVEESQPVVTGTEGRLMEKFEELIKGESHLIISGTKAAGFSDTVIPAMVRKAKEKGLLVILDIKGNDLKESLKYEPDLVKPNLYEFASTFMPELINSNDLIQDSGNENRLKEKIKSSMTDIARKYKCGIILTNGSRKILAIGKGNFFEIDILPVQIINSTGCGDAFTAGFAAALEDNSFDMNTLDFEAAIREGMRCGALNAELEKPGVIKD